MKYTNVIFDLDGTLTDSAPGILAGIRYAHEKMNWPLPDDATQRLFLGPPLMVSFTRFSGMTTKEAAKAQDYYREFYNSTGSMNNSVYPGIRQLLVALKKQGVSLGVATHKPLATSIQILKAFDLYRFFDAVAGPEPGEDPSKGELIQRAMKKNAKTIMIGDRATDVIGAQEAGVDGIAALYGYGSRAEFEEVETRFYANRVQDLYELLDVKPIKNRGIFLSFEGNDGTGKSTQAKLLAERLRQNGHDVLLTREPGGTQIGEKIRELLLDFKNLEMDKVTEALLFAAARAQHVKQVILPALQEGKLVISDRFVDSSIAYQGAGRGIGIDQVRAINAPAVAGCMPDVTIFLSLNPDEGIKRLVQTREADRLEIAGDDFHQSVADAFKDMIQREERFLPIDASGSIDEVAARVYEQAQTRLMEKQLI